MNEPLSEISIVGETRHLRLVQRNGWSFAQRTGHVRVVCIMAVTDQRQLLLVEQFRQPVGCNVIELPAGLAGDIAEQASESLEEAAKRELFEETGYEAAGWRELTAVSSSAGLTDEVVVLFQASGLRKSGPGGGDESEAIILHEIALDRVERWLESQRTDGKLVDSRVYAAFYFLGLGKIG